MSDAARAAEFAFRMSAMEADIQCLDEHVVLGVRPERNTRVVTVEVVSPERTNTERALRLDPPTTLIDWLSEAPSHDAGDTVMTIDASCRDARQTMVNLRPRLDEDVTLMMAVEGMIAVEEDHFPDRATFEAAAHIEACDACQRWSADWLDGLFPERVAYRERLSRYCCQQMYHAATNPDAEVRFAFEMFRGEDPSWSINEQYAFARFCPWCGQELPNRAFEPEPNA